MRNVAKTDRQLVEAVARELLVGRGRSPREVSATLRLVANAIDEDGAGK